MAEFVEQLAEAIIKRNNLKARLKSHKTKVIERIIIRRNLPAIDRDIEKAKRWLENA